MRLRLPIDRQTLLLLGAVAIAVVFPARGQAAEMFEWVVYGAMTQAWPVTVSNAVALCMAAWVLVMKWRFRDGDPKEAAA